LPTQWWSRFNSADTTRQARRPTVTLLEADTTRLIGFTRVIARVRPNRADGDDAGAEGSHH
jgi:hypothetical protein